LPLSLTQSDFWSHWAMGFFTILQKGKFEMKNKRSSQEKFAPIHPGEILLEEFLKPMALTQYKLAKDIQVPARRINEIVHGLRGITADTALRLAKYFGTSENFWINLQSHYDLEIQKDKIHKILDDIRTFKDTKGISMAS
ncbi:MAG: HigA family addiction module antitoxin, partial [Clostridiales bacterium]